ncbi:protein lethal(2)essential for life-like [Phymastichus coffea]|uniref:protein lethal(2)essential for life-like n=1 Tax=Phymastichus coffea TaxID=108790 RepID=UPI00273AE6E8|nr:protein lethal(2)essential for life-like [Phymastichus coffea]
MSLIPLIFSDWWEDLDRPHHLQDQDFGLGLHPEQLMTPQKLNLLYLQPRRSNYIRPWTELLRQGDRGVSTVEADKDKFQVTLDVQQFKPDEIDVKVVDKYVVINAKHKEKRDEHGWISREFTRKYLIPEQCDVQQVVSKLSSDGILTIMAPRKETPKSKNEKVIKIELTGKPVLKEKEEEKKMEKSK